MFYSTKVEVVQGKGLKKTGISVFLIRYKEPLFPLVANQLFDVRWSESSPWVCWSDAL